MADNDTNDNIEGYVAKVDKIEDFGERLYGAKKNRYLDKINWDDPNNAEKSLSSLWSLDSVKKIEDPQKRAIAFALRDSIPRKKAYGRNTLWYTRLKERIEIVQQVLDDDYTGDLINKYFGEIFEYQERLGRYNTNVIAINAKVYQHVEPNNLTNTKTNARAVVNDRLNPQKSARLLLQTKYNKTTVHLENNTVPISDAEALEDVFKQAGEKANELAAAEFENKNNKVLSQDELDSKAIKKLGTYSIEFKTDSPQDEFRNEPVEFKATSYDKRLKTYIHIEDLTVTPDQVEQFVENNYQHNQAINFDVQEGYPLWAYKATADKQMRDAIIDDPQKYAKIKTERAARLKPPIKALRQGVNFDMKRQGIAYREGDVTGEDLMRAFGLRGGEFGKYVENEKRQEMLNDTYDAFMDLSNMLDIPPRSIGLGGTLSIAFGARGSGNANAHYEHNERVINITKTRGAGSLAHEWFHGLDHYIAGNSNALASNLSTAAFTAKNSSDKEPLHKALIDIARGFEDLPKDDDNPNFPSRNALIDAYRNKPYYGLIHEELARAFEAHTRHTLGAKGIENTFLVAYTDEQVFENSYDRKLYPYPRTSEVEAVSKSFNQFFSALKEYYPEFINGEKPAAIYSDEPNDEVSLKQELQDEGYSYNNTAFSNPAWVKEVSNNVIVISGLTADAAIENQTTKGVAVFRVDANLSDTGYLTKDNPDFYFMGSMLEGDADLDLDKESYLNARQAEGFIKDLSNIETLVASRYNPAIINTDISTQMVDDAFDSQISYVANQAHFSSEVVSHIVGNNSVPVSPMSQTIHQSPAAIVHETLSRFKHLNLDKLTDYSEFAANFDEFLTTARAIKVSQGANTSESEAFTKLPRHANFQDNIAARIMATDIHANNIESSEAQNIALLATYYTPTKTGYGIAIDPLRGIVDQPIVPVGNDFERLPEGLSPYSNNLHVLASPTDIKNGAFDLKSAADTMLVTLAGDSDAYLNANVLMNGDYNAGEPSKYPVVALTSPADGEADLIADLSTLSAIYPDTKFAVVISAEGKELGLDAGVRDLTSTLTNTAVMYLRPEMMRTDVNTPVVSYNDPIAVQTREALSDMLVTVDNKMQNAINEQSVQRAPLNEVSLPTPENPIVNHINEINFEQAPQQISPEATLREQAEYLVGLSSHILQGIESTNNAITTHEFDAINNFINQNQDKLGEVHDKQLGKLYKELDSGSIQAINDNLKNIVPLPVGYKDPLNREASISSMSALVDTTKSWLTNTTAQDQPSPDRVSRFYDFTNRLKQSFDTLQTRLQGYQNNDIQKGMVNLDEMNQNLYAGKNVFVRTKQMVREFTTDGQVVQKIYQSGITGEYGHFDDVSTKPSFMLINGNPLDANRVVVVASDFTNRTEYNPHDETLAKTNSELALIKNPLSPHEGVLLAMTDKNFGKQGVAYVAVNGLDMPEVMRDISNNNPHLESIKAITNLNSAQQPTQVSLDNNGQFVTDMPALNQVIRDLSKQSVYREDIDYMFAVHKLSDDKGEYKSIVDQMAEKTRSERLAFQDMGFDKDTAAKASFDVVKEDMNLTGSMQANELYEVIAQTNPHEIRDTRNNQELTNDYANVDEPQLKSPSMKL